MGGWRNHILRQFVWLELSSGSCRWRGSAPMLNGVVKGETARYIRSYELNVLKGKEARLYERQSADDLTVTEVTRSSRRLNFVSTAWNSRSHPFSVLVRTSFPFYNQSSSMANFNPPGWWRNRRNSICSWTSYCPEGPPPPTPAESRKKAATVLPCLYFPGLTVSHDIFVIDGIPTLTHKAEA